MMYGRVSTPFTEERTVFRVCNQAEEFNQKHGLKTQDLLRGSSIFFLKEELRTLC
jgi:hypothetical protein